MFPEFLVCPSVLGRGGHFVEEVEPLFSESACIFLPGCIWSIAAKRVCLLASHLPVREAGQKKQCRCAVTQHSLRPAPTSVKPAWDVGGAGGIRTQMGVPVLPAAFSPFAPQKLDASPG